MKWRLMVVEPRSGAENMARDSALMDRARNTGEAVFSVYAWQRPTLSLGRNQTARGLYDAAEIERRGLDVVRRPTGGRALLHHREVTYSVTAPIAAGESLAGSYERINAILLDALSSLGVYASEADAPVRALTPGSVPCFAEPARGELVWNGQKLVGSAQLREDGAMLQHGSILVEDDQQLITAVSLTPPSQDAIPAATLRQALGRIPAVNEVADALFSAVMLAEDASARRIDESEIESLTAHHLEKYSSDWWTWRR